MTHQFNSYNTPEQEQAALTRLQDLVLNVYGDRSFNENTATRLFYALNGKPVNTDPQVISEEFQAFNPEYAGNLARVSPVKVTLTQAQWGRLQVYRIHCIKLIQASVRARILDQKWVRLVETAFTSSKNTLLEWVDEDKVELFPTLGEVSFITDLKAGYQPVRAFWVINDNSQSMGNKGSILSIPVADVSLIANLRNVIKASVNQSYCTYKKQQDAHWREISKQGIFHANRLEEQFISDVHTFLTVQAAVGDRLAQPEDYDTNGNLTEEAKAANKLAYYLVPLNYVYDNGQKKTISQNCTYNSGLGETEQYTLKKKFPITSKEALIAFYESQYYMLAATPLASVTNAVLKEIDPQDVLIMRTDGAEQGRYHMIRDRRKPYEVINEFLPHVLAGNLRSVSLNPMTDELDNTLLTANNLLEAMKIKREQVVEALTAGFKDKDQLKQEAVSNGGRVNYHFMKLDGGEAAWMESADAIVSGYLDCNDDPSTERLQAMLKIIMSLPLQTKAEAEQANRLWLNLRGIMQVFAQLTRDSHSLSADALEDQVLANCQKFRELEIEINEINERNYRTNYFDQHAKMVVVTPISDNEDDFHPDALERQMAVYVNAMGIIGYQLPPSYSPELPPEYSPSQTKQTPTQPDSKKAQGPSVIDTSASFFRGEAPQASSSQRPVPEEPTTPTKGCGCIVC